jgi:hypothetical protein
MARSGISNLGGVVKSLAAAKRKAIADAERVVRSTATDILNGVVDGTPEDTSVTIGDWQTAINTTPSDKLDSPDPGGSAAKARGQATILTAKIGDKINIVNNQEHVEGLNAGNAVSKPAGWIEAAIDNATRRRP